MDIIVSYCIIIIITNVFSMVLVTPNFKHSYMFVFILRALKPPGWKKQWLCGVRVESNKKLVGFISAVPACIKIFDV